MAQAQKNDGRDLENAVAAVENLILQASGVKPERITIEPRKIVTTDGVKDEVDLYVRVEAALGYASTVLFECKDWKDPVGKTQIEAFQGKMRRLGAQTGFFMARTFTSDARALAALAPKVVLREIIKADGLDFANMSLVHFQPIRWTYHARFKAQQSDASVRIVPREQVKDLPSELWGMMLPYGRAAREVLREAANDDVRAEHGPSPAPGDYRVELSRTRLFESAEFLVNGKSVRGLTVQGSVCLTFIAPTKVIAFDVQGRGRTIEYTWTTLEGEVLVGRIVQTDQFG